LAFNHFYSSVHLTGELFFLRHLRQLSGFTSNLFHQTSGIGKVDSFPVDGIIRYGFAHNSKFTRSTKFGQQKLSTYQQKTSTLR